MQAEAIRDFEPAGADQESQLRLSTGDLLHVLEQDGSGWWAGHKEGCEATGWFPRSAVTLLASSSASLAAPSAHNAMSTSDGRRVASPQLGGQSAPSGALTAAALKTQCDRPAGSFMKSHANPSRSYQEHPLAKQGATVEPGQSSLLDNLAKALEVERRFAKGLEAELQCLRELSGEEVRHAALEKAWQASAEPSTTSDSKAAKPPTVRDLVAAYEQRAKTGGNAAASAGSPPETQCVQLGAL